MIMPEYRSMLRTGGLGLLAVLLAAGLCGCGGGSSGQDSRSTPTVMPDITTQPLSMTAAVGQTAAFQVAVTGTPTPTLQWKRSSDGKTWSDLPGAVNLSYTTPTLALTDDGAQFCVQATNTAGNPTSQAALLHVVPATTGLTLLAGAVGGSGNVDGVGTAARFSNPSGIAVDANGNVFVTDQANNTIRMIRPGGQVTCMAGSWIQGSGDGTGGKAGFFAPMGVAAAQDGTLFVADHGNYTVRKVFATGAVSTLAGLAGIMGSDNGLGTAARFFSPSAVAVDAQYNVYVVEDANATIRKITPAGLVSSLAGSPWGFGSADGQGSAAQFFEPGGIAVDGQGNCYVADTLNHSIRKVTPTGYVSTLAGSAGKSGYSDGTGAGALFDFPMGLAVDTGGNLYIADSANAIIRKMTPSGTVTTLAGSPENSGFADGVGSAARFNDPCGICVDAGGTLYVADSGNNVVRKITPAGVVSTLGGNPAQCRGGADGAGATARFYAPMGMSVGPTGDIFVADGGIRKVDGSGNVTTLQKPGVWFETDVAVDGSGNIFTVEPSNYVVHRMTPAGESSVFAGMPGLRGAADGQGQAARFENPVGLAIDSSGNLFVADFGNATIRRITPSGQVSTPAGSPLAMGTVDGIGEAARFKGPGGLAVDVAGNVYIADSLAQTIRKMTPSGLVSTLAGTPGIRGWADGTGSEASFDFSTDTKPRLAVDSRGNVFVADYGNHTVRKITPAGVVTTLVGSPGKGGSLLGSLPGILCDPSCVAIDAKGELLIMVPDALLVTMP